MPRIAATDDQRAHPGAERFAVTDTLDRYAEAVDARRWEILEEIFTDDVVWTWPDGRTTAGRAAVIEALRTALAHAGPSHSLFGSYRVSVEGDRAGAKVHRRSYFSDATGGRRFMESLGDYQVEMVRRDGAWRIERFREAVFIRRGSTDVFAAPDAVGAESSRGPTWEGRTVRSSRVTPFTIAVPDDKLEQIEKRVAAYEFPPEAKDSGWDLGTSTAYLKELCEYWVKQYDWREAERGLNSLSHFHAPVAIGGEQIPIHFVHEKGSGPDPTPLLLVHGWPGSFFEFVPLVERLAHPERFGGYPADSFDVVVPSLPGYGFSGKPSSPVSPMQTAPGFHELMHDVLRYDKYMIQGGDWGAVVTSTMAMVAPERVLGLHLNMLGLGYVAAEPPTDATEVAFFEDMAARMQALSGYVYIQATKPETLGFALMDSPVGTCAWIVEKFHDWSDLEDGDIESRYSKDDLLTNVMIYLVNDAIKTSTWYYQAFFSQGGMAPPNGTVDVPTAVANFPRDAINAWPPRSYVEKIYTDVRRWTDMPSGGHFAAMEEPDLWLQDVQTFARELRGG
jgi:uncharacterized protein (TIGR02246 family)